MMITFNQPLWLLLFIPLFWLLTFSWIGKKRVSFGLIWSFKLWGQKAPNFGSLILTFFVFLARIAFYLVLICLVLIMAKPQRIYKERSYFTDGNSIIVILDTSPSMAVRDLGIETRFELAKSAIERFIGSRENDLLGLVTFGKEAVLRSPLTRDYEYFRKLLIQTKILEHGDGTSIGTALALATLHLRESAAKSKSVILITDGDNNSGEIHPDAAVRILKNFGIRVYVVGLGREGNNNVTVENPYTREILQGIVRDAYNQALLEKIAFETAGKFFHAETLVAFESLFQSIDSRNTKDRQFMLVPKVKEYTQFLFLLSLLCLSLHFFVRFLILKEAL